MEILLLIVLAIAAWAFFSARKFGKRQDRVIAALKQKAREYPIEEIEGAFFYAMRRAISAPHPLYQMDPTLVVLVASATFEVASEHNHPELAPADIENRAFQIRQAIRKAAAAARKGHLVPGEADQDVWYDIYKFSGLEFGDDHKLGSNTFRDLSAYAHSL